MMRIYRLNNEVEPGYIARLKGQKALLSVYALPC